MLCVGGGGGGKNNVKEGDPHGSRAPVVAWGAIKNQASALCKLPADLTGAIKRRFVAKKLPIPHHNCNRAQCAGKFQHVLDAFTAHQGHQELWNRSPFQPSTSS